MSKLIYLLTLENLISDPTQTERQSPQRGQPTFPGKAFLAFPLDSFILSAKTLAYSVTSYFYFSSYIVCQEQHVKSCLQDMRSNKTLNLRGSGHKFLTVFGVFLTTYWRTSSSLETERFADSATSLGPRG